MVRTAQRSFSILLFLILLTVSAQSGQALEFFDIPREFPETNVRFPSAGSLNDDLVLLYQEVVPNQNGGGRIYLRLQTAVDGRDWADSKRISSAISYSSDSPPAVFSAVFSGDRITIALAEESDSFSIYQITSIDSEVELLQRIRTDGSFVAPRLFDSSDGFLLFTNRHQDFRINIHLAVSSDGITWSDFERFSIADNTSLNFNPDYAELNGKEAVIYQALDPTVAGAYQLYIRHRVTGGQWSSPIRVTTFAGSGTEADNYDNQRPDITVHNNQFYLTWERRFANQTRHVFTGRLNDAFLLDSNPEQVSTGFNNANAPAFFTPPDSDSEPMILWTQSRPDGDRLILARREGFAWTSEIMNDGVTGSASFPNFVSNRDRLHIFWQNRQANLTRIAYIPPDQHVDPPLIRPLNIQAGGRSRSSFAEFTIEAPSDPSGVVGYSYVWTGNPIPLVPRIENPSLINDLRLSANIDGRWYLHIRAKDAAGNWSEPASMFFTRDTTPPPKVVFNDMEKTDSGMLVSNTFTASWEPSRDPNVIGYSLRYQRVGAARTDFPDPESINLLPPPAAITTRGTEFRRVNEDNGLWVLTVSAVDDVGNRSEPAYLFLPLNNYVPITIVRLLEVDSDALGQMRISISGRGFSADGLISSIRLQNTETGQDVYTFSYENNDYDIPSDTLIRNIRIPRPLAGTYRIILEHSTRGRYQAPRTLEIDASGTVKYGDFTIQYQPSWALALSRSTIIFSFSSIWFWLILLFLLLIAVVSAFQILQIRHEAHRIRQETQALIKGELMKLSGPKQAASDRKSKRGAGLRIKFTVFAALLVTSVVLMVAITLGSFVLETQSRTLSQGLQDRVEVLIDSMVSAAAGFLPAPEGNVPELNILANQISVMPEAMYATITGRGREDASEFNYIWASNDPVHTEGLIRGETILEDALSDEIAALEEYINEEARAALSDIARQIDNFTADIIRLALDPSPEAELERREIDMVRSELETQLSNRLNEIGGRARSIPEFDPEALSADQTEYIFYQPVLYRNPNEDVYFRGAVRLGVSTELILEEIAASQSTLIWTTGIIALIAVTIGVFGALLLATIIIIPINRLVKGVEVIRTTVDKRQLRDHLIQVKTRDELHVLAESVNLMTQGLVKAAEASEELTIGKEVQKMFIPLTQKDGKTKLSTGREDTDSYEFFGYYEGAKTVSGDYFSYSQLDPQTYALIKCDVAGKGVSAALIMVEVATLFLDHFRGWNDPKLSGKLLLQHREQLKNMDMLLFGINDLLESTALAGRFAALTTGILDIQKNRLTLANAGDNQVHMYRFLEKKTRQYEMPDAPAAGVFSSDFIPNGYRPAVFELEIGDIVLFFTDGLEEAKRILRDQNFQQMQNADGVGDEEFSIERIHRITEAVQSRGVYYLERQNNPIPDEVLRFDYSDVEPTAENTVLALIAAEQIMRMYLDPQAGEDDKATVDRVVDNFLQKTFSLYDTYFAHPVESKDKDQEYRQFKYVKEDDQYDDLTLLAIRRKK
ncbi:PP2C family protein-serine/threonine phosphatase [Spirochaeta dissipatitropha]